MGKARELVSEEFLAGDGGDEVLEIERLDVGGVLEAAGVPGGEGGAEHCGSFRAALGEMRVGMREDLATFAGAVADEQHRALGQQIGEGDTLRRAWQAC